MNEPSFFTPDFLQFYRDLAAHNDRDWFHANRERYEHQVKRPFELFVNALVVEMRKVDPVLELEAKDAIFRINRDVRFSKDKSPYKLHSSAVISRGGKKDTVSPGIYVELGPERIAVYGGVYMPDKDQLEAIRHHIAAHPEKFDTLLQDNDFKAVYGTLRGERNKKLSKDLQQAAAHQPLLYNKAFYFFTHLPAEEVLRPGLVKRVIALRNVGAPMSEFLFDALIDREG